MLTQLRTESRRKAGGSSILAAVSEDVYLCQTSIFGVIQTIRGNWLCLDWKSQISDVNHFIYYICCSFGGNKKILNSADTRPWMRDKRQINTGAVVVVVASTTWSMIHVKTLNLCAEYLPTEIYAWSKERSAGDKQETISDHMSDTSLHYPATVPPPRVGCCQYSRGFLPSAFLSALAVTSNQARSSGRASQPIINNSAPR